MDKLNSDILDFKNYFKHTGNVFITQTIIIIGFILLITTRLFVNLFIIIIIVGIVLAVYAFNQENFALYRVPSPMEIINRNNNLKNLVNYSNTQNLLDQENRNEILNNIKGCVEVNTPAISNELLYNDPNQLKEVKVNDQLKEGMEELTPRERRKKKLYELMKSKGMPDYSVIDSQAYNVNDHPNIQKFQTKSPKDDYFTTTDEKAYQMTCKNGFINPINPCSKERSQAIKFIYGKSRRIIRY